DWDEMYAEIRNLAVAWGTRMIIDDILLYSTDPNKLLTHFECVCRIFQKCRVSFHHQVPSSTHPCRCLDTRHHSVI
ncbi:MAG: hypothetical protein ACREBR_01630, partial [bacterium]